jgi:hypothetical protein
MTFQHADTTHHCELKFFMYLVAIGWLYVALMMAVAEANHPSGTVLGRYRNFFVIRVATYCTGDVPDGHPFTPKSEPRKGSQRGR